MVQVRKEIKQGLKDRGVKIPRNRKNVEIEPDN
jgi:hypothetical protein